MSKPKPDESEGGGTAVAERAKRSAAQYLIFRRDPGAADQLPVLTGLATIEAANGRAALNAYLAGAEQPAEGTTFVVVPARNFSTFSPTVVPQPPKIVF